MSDIHTLPLLGHDLPDYVIRDWVKPRVSMDPGTQLWVWEHQCRHRVAGRPFHGIPYLSPGAAYEAALFHAEHCL